MASLVEADRPRRGWRQIDVTPADKGTAIIDPHRHASIVADADQRPKRKRAVRRGHCGTVEELRGCGSEKDGDQLAEFCEWVNRSNRDVRRTA